MLSKDRLDAATAHPPQQNSLRVPRDFPQRLKRFKEESGLSWAELARRLGTYPHTLYRWWKQGVRPSAHHFGALLVLNQHIRRRPPGEEAGEMRRKRIAPRVKLNRAAVWELLDELGISQNELARLCGLSSGYFSQLMSGVKSPSPRVRRKLQQVLGVSDFDRLFIIERANEIAPTSNGPFTETPLP